MLKFIILYTGDTSRKITNYLKDCGSEMLEVVLSTLFIIWFQLIPAILVKNNK